MEDFVDNDQGQRCFPQQFAFKNDFAPSNETCRVHRRASVCSGRKQFASLGG